MTQSKNVRESPSDGSKLLPCAFYDDVLCSYQKDSKLPRIMNRCFKCSHYERFMAEMDKAEDEFWEWEAKVRANPEAYQRGEL